MKMSAVLFFWRIIVMALQAVELEREDAMGPVNGT